MEEAGFPQWNRLCDDLKLEVISRMDLKTRRFLRRCSKKDSQLAGRFPWIAWMDFADCKFCTSTGRWYYHHAQSVSRKKFFNTREEACDKLKRIIRSVVVFFKISIESTLDSKVELTDARRINVAYFSWKFIESESNESRLECYNFLFNQIDLLELKSLEMDMDEVRNCTPMQNDSLFELERTKMHLEYLEFSGLVNDEQFLGIRALDFRLKKCGLLTPAAFFRFIKKRILQPSLFLYGSFKGISSEVQFAFLGELYARSFHNEKELILNVVGSNNKLCVKFKFHNEHEIMAGANVIGNQQQQNSDDDDYDGRYYCGSIEVRLAKWEHLQFDRVNIMETNNSALTTYPTLNRFLAKISEGLPSGFSLL